MSDRVLGNTVYIDSHCHLYDTRGAEVTEVIESARAAGVTKMITIGCDADTTQQAIDIAARFEGVFATAGLHPHDAVHGVDTIRHFFDDPNVIAVGEAGLDYFYEHSPRAQQRVAFADQINIAHERKLPLVVHARDAWDDTFDVFAAEGVPERTIFHCFTGGPEEARRCLDLGAYLSFSGILTFKTATDLQEAAKLCPADRMLAETDSPYLAPVPYRGSTNRPEYVIQVVQTLADLRGAPLDDVRQATVENACRAFPALRS